MNVAKLGIEVDASQAVDAVETLKALADAAERASAALDQLSGKQHGGLTIKIVGGVGLVEIHSFDLEAAKQELANQSQALGMGY